MKNTFNVLLCVDDFKGNYTRHCAVTIISLLETNKNHNIKIFIMSSCLQEENKEELKRIVKSYNQEIEFIIRDNIIPEEIKTSVINRRNLTWGTWYRLFFPLYIKDIDRLLYIDCDVIVNKDIDSFYNMDMKGKAIVGYYDNDIIKYEKKVLNTNHYVNAGVLLFDVNLFQQHPLKKNEIDGVNSLYNQRLDDSDQDYLNIIYKDEILVHNKGINYLIEKPFFNPHLDDAIIFHCLAKPYIKYTCCPKKIEKLYYDYLNKTKWKGYPKQNRLMNLGGYLYDISYWFTIELTKKVFGIKSAVWFHKTSQNIIKRVLHILNLKK